MFYSSVVKMFSRLHQSIESSMAKSSHQLVVLGMIMFFGFPILYWCWSLWLPQPYESPLLRLLGSLLGLGLMLSPYWPSSIKTKMLPWYWFIAVLYTLPFFFMYFFLMNHANDASSMALLCSVFLLMLIVDVVSFWLLVSIGFTLALLAFFCTSPEWYFSDEHAEVILLILFVGVAGSFVIYKNTLIQQQRLAGIAAAAGMIAHELRTPLLGIKSGAQGLARVLPILLESYSAAKAQGLIKTPIRENKFAQLEKANERIIQETDFANTIIDMLLIKAGQENTLERCELEICSVAECIQEALDRYPFRSQASRALVHWQGDFQFLGSKLLMQHVLFNLLKNALYMIDAAQKGEISIWTERHETFNVLVVQDTAKGMTKKQLLHLFDDFYSTTFMGTGIGLSFCKRVMKRFGGEIDCETEEGKYARFSLTFPLV